MIIAVKRRRNRETGTLIDEFNSRQDKRDGIYEEDFYEIVSVRR